jgi:hypothetical protein
MALEEVVAGPPTPEEVEDETEGDDILQCLWRNVVGHFFSVWVTKTKTFFLFHFLAILKEQTKPHSQR